MERRICKVVAKSRVTPEPVLDPKRAVEDRIVLLGRARLEPDPPQPVKRAQQGLGHRGAFAREKAAPYRREIGEKDRGQKQACRARGLGVRPGWLRRPYDGRGSHGAHSARCAKTRQESAPRATGPGPPPSAGIPPSSSDVKNIVISAIF